MELRVSQSVSKVRWIFLPLGLCALVAAGAHSAADVMSDRALFVADRVGALFDSIFARWSLTAPLVDLVGPAQRTFFARGLALAWELSADALLAIPLLNYQERAAREELQLLRAMPWRKPSPWLLTPAAALLVGVAGARAVARMVSGSLLHFSFLSRALGAATLLALLGVLLPRAVFRSLEKSSAQRAAAGAFALVILVPLAIAAVASL